MPNNYTSHEANVNLSIQLNRWILQPLGAWPKFKAESQSDYLLRKLLNTLCYGLIVFLMIPCTLYVILEVEDVYNKIKLTGPLSFCLMAIMKYCSLVMRENQIRRCINCIEDDWRRAKFSEDRRIMTENAMFGRRLVVICGLFMYGGAAFYYLVVPFGIGKVFDETANVTHLPLVFPVASLIVDTRRSPVNEIVFSVQCLSGLIAHSITTGACSLAAAFAMHACGQLKVLMSWLEHLVDGRKNVQDGVDERFANIVEQHVRVLSFISLTEKLLHEISLVEIVGCTLNMCFLGYYIIAEWEVNEPFFCVTYCILLMSFTFNIFIFCYIGELLAEQCKIVGEKSYMIDWYRLPGKKSHGLVMVIAMSNSSVKLTAGNLIELSLASFGDVIKTSVAYLNMLRKLTT